MSAHDRIIAAVLLGGEERDAMRAASEKLHASCLTKEEAIAFYQSGAWEPMTAVERARFQLRQRFQAIPWTAFGAALEEACGRFVTPVETLDSVALLAEIDARHGSEPAA